VSGEVSVQVVIMYYKEYDYFRQALNSVLNQDYPSFSILIIDDGSHDERATDYILSLGDPRIVLKQNVESLGLSRNFELARLTATGDYIVFLGQDDLLEPDYISSILPWIKNSNSIGMIQPKVKVINEFGDTFFSTIELAKKFLNGLAWILGRKKMLGGVNGSILTKDKAASILLLGDFLYFPTIMWKSSFMNCFDTARKITLDYLMVMDVLSNNGELLLLSKQSARYRRHSRSASMIPEEMVNRLLEEREFHKGLKNHDLLKSSWILRIVNSLRFTQRLHGLQVFTGYLFNLDWENSRRALKSVL
jgi:glycosyltransferase involved in cell wall biosynthesis